MQEQRLATALDAGNADDFTGANGQRYRRQAQPPVLDTDAVELDQSRTQLRRLAPAGSQDLAKHMLDQPIGAERRLSLRHNPASPQYADVRAQLVHVLQLVRDEDNRLALLCQDVQRSEEAVFLAGCDAGGRLIENEHVHTGAKQAHDLELLPLSHREAIDRRIDVEAETEARCHLLKLATSAGAIRPDAAGAPE